MTEANLAGRAVVVTGAGNGLGRAHALLLALHGAAVVVNDIEMAAGEEVAQDIAALGGAAVSCPTSVAEPDGAQAIVDAALDSFGRLDGVVNNAGILRDRTLAKLTREDIDLVVDVHLKGSLFMARAAFPTMKRQRFGRFVHTSSAAGVFGNFGQANYAAAKMGVVGLSRVIAQEGAAHGITSNVVCPLAHTRLAGETFRGWAERLTPTSVSPLVVHLLSPGCPVTGEVFSAGGGHFARIAIGVTGGWSGDGPDITVDDVRDHWRQICDPTAISYPSNAEQQLTLVLSALTPGSK